MLMSEYVDEIKLEITGGITHLEIPDETIEKTVNKCFREVKRYIDIHKFVTVPYAPCIDLTGFKAQSIAKVYRTEGYTGDSNQGIAGGVADPMYAQQWMVFANGGNMFNLNDYILNYLSYNTLLQMRNTSSTDMAFRVDTDTKQLYVNAGYDKPVSITIEFVPEYDTVEDIKDEYWIDILQRMSLSMTKIILGRIRSKYTQSNALWGLDGDKLLEEGTTELSELRETLRVNNSMILPID